MPSASQGSSTAAVKLLLFLAAGGCAGPGDRGDGESDSGGHDDAPCESMREELAGDEVPPGLNRSAAEILQVASDSLNCTLESGDAASLEMGFTIDDNIVDFSQLGGPELEPGRCDWSISTRVAVDFTGNELSGTVDTSTLLARYDHRPEDVIVADGRAESSDLGGTVMADDAPSALEVQLLFEGDFETAVGDWSIALRGFSEVESAQWVRLISCRRD